MPAFESIPPPAAGGSELQPVQHGIAEEISLTELHHNLSVAYGESKRDAQRISNLKSFLEEKAEIDLAYANALQGLCTKFPLKYRDGQGPEPCSAGAALQALHSQTGSSAAAIAAAASRVQRQYAPALARVSTSFGSSLSDHAADFAEARTRATAAIAAVPAAQTAASEAMLRAKRHRTVAAVALQRASLSRAAAKGAATAAAEGRIPTAAANEVRSAAAALAPRAATVEYLVARAVRSTVDAQHADSRYIRSVFKAQSSLAHTQPLAAAVARALRAWEEGKEREVKRVAAAVAEAHRGAAEVMGVGWEAAEAAAVAVPIATTTITPAGASDGHALSSAPASAVADDSAANDAPYLPSTTSALLQRAEAFSSCTLQMPQYVPPSHHPILAAAAIPTAMSPGAGAEVAPSPVSAHAPVPESNSSLGCGIEDLELEIEPSSSEESALGGTSGSCRPTPADEAAAEAAAAAAAAAGGSAVPVGASQSPSPSGGVSPGYGDDEEELDPILAGADAAMQSVTGFVSALSSFFAPTTHGSPSPTASATTAAAAATGASANERAGLVGVGGRTPLAPAAAPDGGPWLLLPGDPPSALASLASSKSGAAAPGDSAYARSAREVLLTGGRGGGSEAAALGVGGLSLPAVQATLRRRERALLSRAEIVAKEEEKARALARAKEGLDVDGSDDDQDGLLPVKLRRQLNTASAAATAAASAAVSAVSAAASVAVATLQKQVHHGGSTANQRSVRPASRPVTASEDVPGPPQPPPELVAASIEQFGEIFAAALAMPELTKPIREPLQFPPGQELWLRRPERISKEALEVAEGLCSTKAGRMAFVDVFNRMRTAKIDEISAPAFRNLVALCRLCLDWCLGSVASSSPGQQQPFTASSRAPLRAPTTSHDVGAAQIIDVLANSVFCRYSTDFDPAAFTERGCTWERIDEAGSDAEVASDAVTDAAVHGGSSNTATLFLRVGLKWHPLWQEPEYWNNCLVENVAKAVARNGGSSQHDVVECVYGVLPNMMSTMLGYDVPVEHVHRFVISWATRYGLSKEHVRMLEETFQVLASNEQQ